MRSMSQNTSTKTVFELTLPDTPKYQGRMPTLDHETSAYSKEQALSQVLQKYGCLYLYEEFLPEIDKIVKVKEPGYRQLRLF